MNQQTTIESPVTQVPHAIDAAYTKHLHDHAYACLHELHNDYFSAKTFEDFCKEHLGHTAVISKILAYRFFSTEIFKEVLKRLEPHAKKVFNSGDLILHPIFYMRFTFPELAITEKHKKAFLDTQPHFDRSFNLHAYSFWLGLVDIDDQTGGLCYFNDPKLNDVFMGEGKNKYNLDSYIDNSEELDKILRPATRQPHIKAGSVLTFHSDILHGATKPKTRWRVSCDFRFVPKNQLQTCEPRARKILTIFNESPTLCNVNNLILLGDYLGASRHLKNEAAQRKDSALAEMAETLAIKPPDAAILLSGAKMRWQSEYQWL